MNREVLERMTKEELMCLIDTQDGLIKSLDKQRYASNAIIDLLSQVVYEMNNLRRHDAGRSNNQDRLDDCVRAMSAKYPLYIVPAEDVSKAEERLKNLFPHSLWEEETSDDMKGQPLKGEEEC